MALSCETLDAFWLPASLRPLTRDVEWEVHHVVAGRPVPPGEGVAVRWPRLTHAQWEALLAELRAARGPALLCRTGSEPLYAHERTVAFPPSCRACRRIRYPHRQSGQPPCREAPSRIQEPVCEYLPHQLQLIDTA